MKHTLSLRLFAAAAALGLAGCMHPSATSHARMGPFFTPKNYSGETRIPASVHRVVLLPVCGGEFAPPEEAEALDPVFTTALERQMRFEVVTLQREDCEKCFGSPEIASVSALPHGFLEELGRRYDAEAVMWVDVTAYQAYRPLTLGIRAKLALISDHRLIWAFDEVFSAADPAVANSVRRYYIQNELSELPVDLTPAALESPSRFAAYAADAAFRTLPRP